MSTQSTSKNGGLTRYPLGSLRELCSITFPLMISLISVSVMQFSDRVFLARYSLDALNSSANGWMLAFLFLLGGLSTAGISEVFVGQYNGAKEYKKIGSVVWQMVYFSLVLSLLYIPIAKWGGEWLMQGVDYEGEGSGYFKGLLYFGSAFPFASAVSGFFIGRGKVKLVTMISIFANLINIVLDPLFIFGWAWIPSMGAQGAAMATGISQTINGLILFALFLRPKNWVQYGVSHMRFQWSLFKQCLWIGVPRSIAHILEMAAWTLTTRVIYHIGKDYASVSTVTQSFFVLTSFLGESMSRGVTVVASNMIGAKKLDKVKKLLKSMMRLTFFFFLFQGLIYVVFVDQFLSLFLNEQVIDAEYIKHLFPYLRTSALIFWVLFLFDCMLWGTNGVLTAAGDTRFVMVVSGITPWLFGLLPTYIALRYVQVSPDKTMLLALVYAVVTLAFNLWRLKSGAWKRQHVID